MRRACMRACARESDVATMRSIFKAPPQSCGSRRGGRVSASGGFTSPGGPDARLASSLLWQPGGGFPIFSSAHSRPTSPRFPCRVSHRGAFRAALGPCAQPRRFHRESGVQVRSPRPCGLLRHRACDWGVDEARPDSRVGRVSCGAIRPSGSPAHASGHAQWHVQRPSQCALHGAASR